jgi:hypothetical protein
MSEHRKGSYEKLFPWNPRCFDPSPDSSFVLIHGSTIDVAISGLKCNFDSLLNFSLIWRRGVGRKLGEN